jgi:hypothetical protein
MFSFGSVTVGFGGDGGFAMFRFGCVTVVFGVVVPGFSVVMPGGAIGIQRLSFRTSPVGQGGSRTQLLLGPGASPGGQIGAGGGGGIQVPLAGSRTRPAEQGG